MHTNMPPQFTRRQGPEILTAQGSGSNLSTEQNADIINELPTSGRQRLLSVLMVPGGAVRRMGAIPGGAVRRMLSIPGGAVSRRFMLPIPRGTVFAMGAIPGRAVMRRIGLRDREREYT